jgi:hypothetical protein
VSALESFTVAFFEAAQVSSSGIREGQQPFGSAAHSGALGAEFEFKIMGAAFPGTGCSGVEKLGIDQFEQPRFGCKSGD